METKGEQSKTGSKGIKGKEMKTKDTKAQSPEKIDSRDCRLEEYKEKQKCREREREKKTETK